MDKMKIDGSMLEGGGQILRNAAALAVITCRPLQVDRIRAGRSKPGLAAQHLTGLRLIAEQLSQGGKLAGGQVGSTSVELQPGRLRCASVVADTQTAGSCVLLAQAALPCLLFAEPEDATYTSSSSLLGQQRPSPGLRTWSELELRGGTDADMAPPGAYLRHVLAPLLADKLGVKLQVELARRGFYPKGGGIMRVSAQPLPLAQALPPLDLTQRGRVVRVTIRAFSAGRVISLAAQHLADAAQAELLAALGPGVPLIKEAVHEPPERAVGDGAGILLVAETDTGCLIAASARGERGTPAEATAAVCANDLVTTLRSGGCVDEYLQDQLIIFMALAAGQSRVLCGTEPTLHTRTAMVVAEQLLPGVSFTVTRPHQAHGHHHPAGDSSQHPETAAAGAGAAAAAALPAGADEASSAGAHQQADSAGAAGSGGSGSGWLLTCNGAGLTRQKLGHAV